MARISSAISDELLEKCQITLKQQGKTGEISRRLQAIISAKYHNISKVASIFGVTRATMMRWIKDFEKESIGGLVVRKGRGRKKIFTKDCIYIIKENIAKNWTETKAYEDGHDIIKKIFSKLA